MQAEGILLYPQLITGQEFDRVENLPAKWFVDSVLIKVARAVSPSVEIGGMSAPSVLMPVTAMAQGIVVRHAASLDLLSTDLLPPDHLQDVFS